MRTDIVSHLLVLGDNIPHGLPTQQFDFASWLPPPAALGELDPLELLAFQLLVGDFEVGLNLASEMGVDLPFEAGAPPPSLRDVARYCREHHPEFESAAHAAQARLNSFGAIHAAQWKESNWAAARDIPSVLIDTKSEGAICIRFDDKFTRLAPLTALALRHPSTEMAVIVVDPKQLSQTWFSTEILRKGGTHQTQKFKDSWELSVSSWLVQPPPEFPY